MMGRWLTKKKKKKKKKDSETLVNLAKRTHSPPKEQKASHCHSSIRETSYFITKSKLENKTQGSVKITKIYFRDI